MQATSYILDEELPDVQVRTTIFSHLSKEELARSVAKVNRLTSDDKTPIAIVNILNYYSTVKRILPDILDLISLNASVHSVKIAYLWGFLQKQPTK